MQYALLLRFQCRFDFPFSRCEPPPSSADPVRTVAVDPELACEGFTYTLASGREGSVLKDQVRDFNRDPEYLRDLLLYRLTVAAQDRMAASDQSRREIARRLGTSASQLYRLLDTTCRTKSLDQMLRLLCVLECDVDLAVRTRTAGHPPVSPAPSRSTP